MRTLRPDQPGRINSGLRLDARHGVARGEPLTIVLDGQPIHAFRGETVAGALLASGRRLLRTTAVRGESRGLFCGMGICYDCLMIIDQRPSRRACMTFVEDGMLVDTQVGSGASS